ncbi:unnamed protein product [Ceutorhynchus assimilis]|uniref:DUF7041 domain-containing protein n=1 Tax=Ceutorhynchus assimilis TaxID=467358 RepID=A0A9N9MWB3_9CUCU|nr:unnamed protein product [Ceutorhynchus assimilis]
MDSCMVIDDDDGSPMRPSNPEKRVIKRPPGPPSNSCVAEEVELQVPDFFRTETQTSSIKMHVLFSCVREPERSTPSKPVYEMPWIKSCLCNQEKKKSPDISPPLHLLLKKVVNFNEFHFLVLNIVIYLHKLVTPTTEMPNTESENSSNSTSANINFKLPEFWPNDFLVWFTQIEAIFATRKLPSDKSKYNILVSSISSELATEVRDILLNPLEQNAYDTLKKVIIKRTTLSDQSRIQKLLHIEELGEEKPSPLLRKIQQLLGEKATTTDKSFIKELFLQRLLTNVKTVLAAMDDSSSLELQAEVADRVMEVNTEIQVASTYQQKNEMDTSFQHPCQCQKNNLALSKDINEIKEMLKSLNIASRTHQTRRTSIPKFQSSRSPTPPPSRYCYYHSRFGKKAQRCNSPCSWSENLRTGN